MKRFFIEVQGINFIFIRLQKSLENGEKLNIKTISGKVIPILLDLIEFVDDIGGTEDVLITIQDKFIQEKLKKEGLNVPKNSMLLSINKEEEVQEQKPMMLENAPAPIIDTEAILANSNPNKKYVESMLVELTNSSNIDLLIECLNNEFVTNSNKTKVASIFKHLKKKLGDKMVLSELQKGSIKTWVESENCNLEEPELSNLKKVIE